MSAKNSAPRDGRSRPRAITDRKIEAAVREIITTDGPQAVTIERVSEVSGVARTTLYRRYRNKFELLQGVAEEIVPPLPRELEIDLEGFRRVLEAFQIAFSTRGIGQLMTHVLSADEEFLAAWRERFIGPRTDVLRDFFERGVNEGLLRPESNDGMMIDVVLGAFLAGNAMHGELPEGWASRLAERLWPAISLSTMESEPSILDV